MKLPTERRTKEMKLPAQRLRTIEDFTCSPLKRCHDIDLRAAMRCELREDVAESVAEALHISCYGARMEGVDKEKRIFPRDAIETRKRIHLNLAGENLLVVLVAVRKMEAVEDKALPKLGKTSFADEISENLEVLRGEKIRRKASARLTQHLGAEYQGRGAEHIANEHQIAFDPARVKAAFRLHDFRGIIGIADTRAKHTDLCVCS